jgi:hypothetical protein
MRPLKALREGLDKKRELNKIVKAKLLEEKKVKGLEKEKMKELLLMDMEEAKIKNEKDRLKAESKARGRGRSRKEIVEKKTKSHMLYMIN